MKRSLLLIALCLIVVGGMLFASCGKATPSTTTSYAAYNDNE